METVNYYRDNNSDVYVLLLDASQAFDKVNYTKLFQLLIDRNVNPMVIRCLLYMYTNQYLNIKWNGCMSKYFSTSNGVKQGGGLSPILLECMSMNYYVDSLGRDMVVKLGICIMELLAMPTTCPLLLPHYTCYVKCVKLPCIMPIN